MMAASSITSEMFLEQLHHCLCNVCRNAILHESDSIQTCKCWNDLVVQKTLMAFTISTPCSVPAIEHGRVTNYAPDARVAHDKHITVDCIAQYELRYNTTPAACNNGSWTHIPTCIPEEEEHYCRFIVPPKSVTPPVMTRCSLCSPARACRHVRQRI
ncbi:protein lev-9 [Caerostris extrusa]|uniref:Protein lev-9 n=1 Tax=Caerostris extrusa TaxID=172846 RepID=A0AAV4WKP5_CAEEX|nr:protein lev-9 [Caerostris extrusa]